MDIFYRTAAYEFSSSFFKVRGLDSDNAIVHINGIKMNKLYNEDLSGVIGAGSTMF